MTQIFKKSILSAILLIQTGLMMAQDVPEKLLGVYKGKATTTLIINEGETKKQEAEKVFDVEIIKTGNDTKLVLKDFKLGDDEFKEIPFRDLCKTLPHPLSFLFLSTIGSPAVNIFDF